MVSEKEIRDFATNLGYTVFPVIGTDSILMRNNFAMIGFYSFTIQDAVNNYFNNKEGCLSTKQLFKLAGTEKHLICLGHPHTAIKNLIGKIERGDDKLFFMIQEDLYFSGVLITIND